MKTRIIMSVAVSLLAVACSSKGGILNDRTRQVLDNSNKGQPLPEWATQSKVSWDQNSSIMFKTDFTVRGDQRVNGCYDMAKLDLKETIITEMKHDIKGEINLASEGIGEAADPMITKAIMTELNGSVQGLKTREKVYERYVVGDVERIDCFILSEMSKVDYNRMRSQIVNNVASVNHDVANALRMRQQRVIANDISVDSQTGAED